RRRVSSNAASPVKRIVKTAIAVSETIATLAVAAWVGGHAALGAFGARILFRDLPRDLAASTMTTVFRSFDGLIAVALGLLIVAMAVRSALTARTGRWRRSDSVATVAASGLVAVGLAGLLWIRPTIERLFHEGRTLTPEFAALHRASERAGHAEFALMVLLFA